MGPPAISSFLLGWFRRLVRRYFRRQFHAVRVSGQEHLAAGTGPLIVFGNHSSWWDPMVAFLLAEKLLPHRAHFAPMDAAALRRYRILGRLGVFPVHMNSPRGAAEFLRTGEAVLASGGVLWVTPQGRFADVRERPLLFKPGLATLVMRVAAKYRTCTVVPLALEYPFWDERLPECLLRIGAPIIAGPAVSSEELENTLRRALTAQMDSLAACALQRDPRLFDTLLEGSAGPGGLYAIGKRIKTALLRRAYVPEHTPIPQPPVESSPSDRSTASGAEVTSRQEAR